MTGATPGKTLKDHDIRNNEQMAQNKQIRYF